MDYTANGPPSERDVVFHVVEFPGRFLGGRLRFTAFGRRRLAPGLAARFTRSRSRAKHLHGVGANLGRVAVLAFLVLPLAGAQLALYVDLRALLQVFASDFG